MAEMTKHIHFMKLPAHIKNLLLKIVFICTRAIAARNRNIEQP